MSQVGLKASLAAMPMFRVFLRDAKSGQLNYDWARQIEAMTGIGTDWRRGAGHFLPLDEFGSQVRNSPWETAESVSQRMARATTAIGGLAPVMTVFQRTAAAGAMARFALDATGEKALNMKRMAVIGIDRGMADKIADNMRQHAGFSPGTKVGIGDSRFTALNLDKWDPDARHAFTTALTRWTNKLMQENDIGQMMSVFGSNAGKMMVQFRTFLIGSYANNTLHNLHMRDGATVANFLGSSLLGALSYIAQTHLQSIGREDQQDFLDKKLSLDRIAAVSIHRGGWASLAPQLVDTGAWAAGFDPMFDVRASGQSSNLVGGIPAMDTASNVLNALRGFSHPLHGLPYTQADMRALTGSLPFGNALPVVWASNAMMQGLPRNTPQRHR